MWRKIYRIGRSKDDLPEFFYLFFMLLTALAIARH
jgi:hypothetical protein